MPRKMPFRPRSEQIAQTYPDGYVDIFTCKDTAQAGYQPKILAEFSLRLNYATQALGINRLYLSRQAHAEVKKVVRVPKSPVTVFQLARDHTGEWFKIDYVQSCDGIMPPSQDLSLVAVTAEVEVQDGKQI